MKNLKKTFSFTFYALHSPKKRAGFTLIELLLVMAIIGVMATFALVNFIGVRQRGRDSQRKSDLVQVRSALELYRSDQGSYPASISFCGGSISFGASAIYMQKTPCDPITPSASPFVYTYSPIGSPPTAYNLVACLENANDGQRDSTAAAGCSGSSYTITNP